MILRRATADDAPACAGIVAGWLSGLDWMPDPPTTATLEPLLRDGLLKREAWVADKGGETRGYLSLDPDTAQIHALYTAQPGTGVGRALMDHVKQGRPYLQLRTHTPNHAAHRFYEREGFRVTRRDIPGDDGVTEIAMEWHA